MRVLTIKEVESEFLVFTGAGCFAAMVEYLSPASVKEGHLFLVRNPREVRFAVREGDLIYISETLHHTIKTCNKLSQLLKETGMCVRETLEFCDL